MRLEIVSSQKISYTSDDIKMVIAPGVDGELGIMPRHAPLLTQVKAGTIKAYLTDGQVDLLYISGGVLEVQPKQVTILADVAQRSDTLDEARIQAARQAAEEKIRNKNEDDIDYATAQAELAQAIAQLQSIKTLRKQTKQ